MVYNNGTTKELQEIPNTKILHWVVIETELRAWVENPAGHLPGEPVFYLCQITDASAQIQQAEVRPINDACGYWVDYSLIHCIHTFAPSHNKIVKVHGEIKGLL